MTKKYDSTNRGALFRNENKKIENHPDYKGILNVKGEDFYISGWLKQTKDGKKYFSLSVLAKEQEKKEVTAKDYNNGIEEDIIEDEVTF